MAKARKATRKAARKSARKPTAKRRAKKARRKTVTATVKRRRASKPKAAKKQGIIASTVDAVAETVGLRDRLGGRNRFED